MSKISNNELTLAIAATHQLGQVVILTVCDKMFSH